MYLAIVSCLTQAVMGAYIPTWSRYPSHAQVVVTPQGYLADTPEVEAAKAAHFVEVARRGGAVPPGYGYYPVVNSEGFLEDTPEVKWNTYRTPNLVAKFMSLNSYVI